MLSNEANKNFFEKKILEKIINVWNEGQLDCGILRLRDYKQDSDNIST